MIKRLIFSKSSIKWCFYLRSNWILKSNFLTSEPKLVSSYFLGKLLKNNVLAYHFVISYCNILYVYFSRTYFVRIHFKTNTCIAKAYETFLPIVDLLQDLTMNREKTIAVD